MKARITSHFSFQSRGAYLIYQTLRNSLKSDTGREDHTFDGELEWTETRIGSETKERIVQSFLAFGTTDIDPFWAGCSLDAHNNLALIIRWGIEYPRHPSNVYMPSDRAVMLGIASFASVKRDQIERLSKSACQQRSLERTSISKGKHSWLTEKTPYPP
jgi:hypothetical protein